MSNFPWSVNGEVLKGIKLSQKKEKKLENKKGKAKRPSGAATDQSTGNKASRLAQRLEKPKRTNKTRTYSFERLASDWMMGAEIVGGVVSLAPSGAPNDVWRRNNDPNTRLFFDSSDVRDANEPVLWKFGRFTFEQILQNFLLFVAREFFTWKRNLNKSIQKQN